MQRQNDGVRSNMRLTGGLVKRRSSFVGPNGFAFGGQIFVEWVVREGAKAGDYGFGVEDGSGLGGVGVRVTEERVDGGRAEGVVAAGDDLVEVDERDMLFFGDGLGPAAVSVGVAANTAVNPDFARDERAEDGRGALGADVGNIFAQIPAEGVDGFGLVGDGTFDFEGLVSDAGQASSAVRAADADRWRRWRCSRRHALIGDGRGARKVEAAVVVAELDEDEVAGLDEFEGVGPVALGDIGVRGEAADGAVDDVDLGGVEEVG